MLQEPGHRLLSILAEYLWESVSSLTHTRIRIRKRPIQRERVVTGDDKRWEPQQRESRGPVGCLSYFRL